MGAGYLAKVEMRECEHGRIFEGTNLHLTIYFLLIENPGMK